MSYANTDKYILNTPYNSHKDIIELLPWHVNNSLNRVESKRVENHLKDCIICQEEILRLQHLAYLIANETYEISSESSIKDNFSMLENRIKINSENQKSHNIISKISQKTFGFRMGKITDISLPKPALAMAATVFISLLLPRLEFNSTADLSATQFQTLSSSEIAVVSKNTVRVIFLDDSQKMDINNLLSSVNGHITSGPTEQGEYAISIDGVLNANNVKNVIENLKKNSNVLFAEPAYTTLTSDNNCEC